MIKLEPTAREWGYAVCFFALLGTTATPVFSQDKDAKTPAKEAAQKAEVNRSGKEMPASVSDEEAIAAIRASAAAFAAAFDDQNAQAIGRLWSKDGEYVNEDGVRFKGRDAIIKEYASFFESNPGLKLNISIESIRLLAPTVAVEEGVATLSPMPGGAPAASRYTAVHVVEGGTWKLGRVRDSRVEIPSQFGRLQSLEWMTGKWQSEHAGVTAEMTCDWVSGKSYLQRTFQVTRDGQTLSSSIEIIGWDPLQQQIVSWTFPSTGGRSTGVWTRTSEGWLASQRGITAQGVPTSSESWWASLDADAIGWSSLVRSADGERLAVPRDVVFKRVNAGEGG